MIHADMEELLIASCLFPNWSWSLSTTCHVLVATEGVVTRLYWMPVLLRLDPFRAELFVSELNGKRNEMMSK